MNDEIIKSGNYAMKQFGTLHDTIVAIIQLLVMVELTFSFGYIHNQLYPPFKTDEDAATTYQYVLLQSVSLIFLFATILFVQQFIKNIYPVKTIITPWMMLVIFNIVFIVVAQTQRSYYNRIKMTYKQGFSILSVLLKMIH